MNVSVFTGYLMSDPIYGVSDKGTEYVRVNVNSPRYVPSLKKSVVNMIACTAFGVIANFIHNKFKKDDKVEVVGYSQGHYYIDSVGKKVLMNNIVIEKIGFAERKEVIENGVERNEGYEVVPEDVSQ